ncbi:PepSY-associated TM helix domain-containing protein [Stieleria neptunia]
MAKPGFRAVWMRSIVAWHWISSAICLVGMLAFAITGITLNHASQIESQPVTESLTAQLPDDLHALVTEPQADDSAPLPEAVAEWLNVQFPRPVGSRNAEWSADEIYVSMPGPGSDAWMAIDRERGAVEFEWTRRGWVSFANDLHKGRNTGAVWKGFLDLFALATLVFCLTGLLLLYEHARRRRMTWPLVGLGVVIPLLLVLLLIH